MREEFIRTPKAGTAIELVTSALIQDERDRDVERAVDLLARQETTPRSDLVADLVAAARGSGEERSGHLNELHPADSRKRVGTLKAVLKREPRNAVRWMDLSRDYASLGMMQKALEAMRVAVALQPDDKFVLRSSTALLAHSGDLDRALHLLRRSPRTFSDPWLAAPIVAVSELMAGGDPVGHRKELARLSEDGKFPARQRAELSAALGTRELSAGSARRARQLLRKALVDPTENALAQIEWLAQSGEGRVDERPTNAPPRAWEASARSCAAQSSWFEAGQQAQCWLVDQPFSLEAAVFGSFVFCEAEDWLSALEVVEAGLTANPESPALLNNKAFALTEAGRLEEAVPVLLSARVSQAHGRSLLTLAATEGLLLMRVGMHDVGRERYGKAIEYFATTGHRELAAKAALMLAREELLAQTPQADEAWRQAERRSRDVTHNDVKDLRLRVEKLSYPAVRGHPRKLERRLERLALPLAIEPPDLEHEVRDSADEANPDCGGGSAD